MTTDGPYWLRDYILTASSSDSLAHTNTGVYTLSPRLVDAVFPNTPASQMMAETQLVSHSTANAQ